MITRSFDQLGVMERPAAARWLGGILLGAAVLYALAAEALLLRHLAAADLGLVFLAGAVPGVAVVWLLRLVRPARVPPALARRMLFAAIGGPALVVALPLLLHGVA